MMIFIGFVFFLIGIGLLISGIRAVFKVRRDLASSSKASGKVMAFGTINGKSGYLYCPQVEFAIPGGQTFRFQSETGSQPPSYSIGQQVEVVYQTANPNQAEINSVMALWFTPGCTVLMAVLFSLLGSALFGIGALVEFLTYRNR
jgi:Protein of unknown function (DUF3592)